ncbi:hypothetical protein HPB47_001059 [Ixodes persulcatus]|uniref:Uncharacterized protein n=1 Tax=Ixodes persulcatus TaxID=34615 RepID=A0AC60PRZ3_IXOPE|nr:hypothetical protein HPB47_001059 [Ixodes persulcatus]
MQEETLNEPWSGIDLIRVFCLKRFGGSTEGATGMTSQLGACSHGRLVDSAYSLSLAKPDSPAHNADTDDRFMGAPSRFQLQLYERRCLFSLQKVLPKNGIFEHELVVEDVPLPVSRAAFAKKPPAVILETGGGDGEPRSEPPPLDVLRLSESSCLLDVPPEESCSTFLYQVFPTFMLAGAGMVAAGLLLDIVQVMFPFFIGVQGIV